MIIRRHTQFRKHYKKRILPNLKLHTRFEERLNLFRQNPDDAQLHDHKLIGEWEGFRAFSITGDIRVVYREKDSDTVEFYDIGTHNQVY